MNIIEEFKKMQQKIDEETKVIMINPSMAQKIAMKDIDCSQFILFHVHKYVANNEALVIQGELKSNMLQLHRDKIIELYTFNELKEKFLSIKTN